MKTKEIIKNLLTKYPNLKDINILTASDLLSMYAQSQLTNAETIRRMRAKLQEEVPSLRGRAYELRKGTIQEKWRKDLGYENN